MEFEEICRENYARIYNYILAKTGKKEAAEAIAQDVFLIALRKGDAFLHHEKPVAFLYVTARNLILEYYKKTKETPMKAELLVEAGRLSYEKSAFGKDAFEELCRLHSAAVNEEDYRIQILRKLKPKERDLYQKYYLDKKLMKTIAQEFHMSETAMRMKYVRLRRKVQRIAAGLKLDEF